MKYFWWLRGLKCVAVVAVVIAGVSWVVMSLWNGLLPGLFGLPSINFVQALGLLILSRILFGGLRGPGFGRGMRWRQRMHERWEKMTPEEREKLRSGLRGRCGPWGRGE